MHPWAKCYGNGSEASPEVGAPPPQGWEECEPIPEWDFIFDVLLSEAPLAKGGALVPGDHTFFTTLAERSLYVTHIAPWSSQREVMSLELLGRALQICEAQPALLHLADEGGRFDGGYQLWPFVIRNYYSAALPRRWGGKVLVAPLGYASGFAQSASLWTNRSGDSPAAPGARPFDFVFFGNGAKGGRPGMLAALARALPTRAVVSSAGFLGRGTVGSGSMAAPLLRQAAFCPTPCGFEHPDSFRYPHSSPSHKLVCGNRF